MTGDPVGDVMVAFDAALDGLEPADRVHVAETVADLVGIALEEARAAARQNP